MKYALITYLFTFLFSTLSGASEDDKSGFQVSKMLSEQAFAHDDTGEQYPKGTVVKTINVSGYTYFQFKENNELTWAATNEMTLPEGSRVVLMKSYPMYDFKSKSLDKTFEKILFVSQLDIIK